VPDKAVSCPLTHSDQLLNLALTRLIDIIGEDANRVPDSIQSKYPDFPWLQMGGAHRRLIHPII